MGSIKLYTEEEIEKLKAHILHSFGLPMHVLHEQDQEVNIDIYIIPPTKEADFYTLITMGMGQYIMNVPRTAKEKKLDRAELLLLLPSNWDIASGDLTWDWPFRWLRILAKLPQAHNSWLGYGHGVGNHVPFSDDTMLSGFVLAAPSSVESAEDPKRCKLPDGDIVNFYQAIPVYEEELTLQEEQGIDALFEKFGEKFSLILDPKRKNYCQE